MRAVMWKAWPADALLASLRLAMMLGLYAPANDNSGAESTSRVASADFALQAASLRREFASAAGRQRRRLL